jgi:hypothetical protein
MPKPAKPCVRCGGVKDEKRQGARYCSSCRVDPTFIQLQKERDMITERTKAAKYRRQKGIQPRAKKIDDNGFVWCKSCHEYLLPNRFKKRSGREGQFEAKCKICTKQYQHEHRLKTVFGIDSIEYHRMLQIQDYRCAICRNKPQSRRLAVDHCHKTGIIRGLLCTHCNHKLLGAAHDSIELLERAICYLESPPAQTGVPVMLHEEYSHKKPRNTP